MGSRGRGRGGGLSLTHEQLQSFGITRGENTATTLAPPPLFPKLEAKPLPLNCDAATDYMVIVKDQFIEYLHESPAYVKPNTRTDGIERYSDKYKQLALDAKRGKVLDCVCANMPAELRPQANRVRSIARKRKLDDANVLSKKLQTLEKKETLDENDEGTENKDEDTVKKENENEDDEDLEDEEEQEYEIDEGTDYANNYFDNGEDYDEEDDNLDDGPVY
ncbi:PREDICTED: DNA-directed RNA polymerase III subunit RPC7-like [Papilio polytes]|uniref:DNA-directed RNA polymerase III subunit RPC7-like n=1 Tax=Papilio polytes TaxID=76194 RepID=UPI0006764A11|nr:PREDICTED: DNA-directed RNA polymerase III subunit RPC7-like [Papilio polytes]